MPLAIVTDETHAYTLTNYPKLRSTRAHRTEKVEESSAEMHGVWWALSDPGPSALAVDDVALYVSSPGSAKHADGQVLRIQKRW